MSVYGVDNQEGGQHSSTDGSLIVGKLENDKVLDVNIMKMIIMIL